MQLECHNNRLVCISDLPESLINLSVSFVDNTNDNNTIFPSLLEICYTSRTSCLSPRTLSERENSENSENSEKSEHELLKYRLQISLCDNCGRKSILRKSIKKEETRFGILPIRRYLCWKCDYLK